MIEFKIVEDNWNKAVILKFEGLARDNAKIRKTILGRIGAHIVGRTVATKLSGQVLRRRFGKLAQSLDYRVEGDHVLVLGTNMRYAAIHEFGGVIVPREKQYLRFVIGRRTIYAKRVVMPRRPYLLPTIENEFANGEAVRIGEAVIEEYSA